MALSMACGNQDIIVGDERLPNSVDVERNINHAFCREAHATLAQIKLAVSDQEWPSFLKFAFVRNPWDLVVSRYHWERKGRECSLGDFRQWLVCYLDRNLALPERNFNSNIIRRVWELGGGYEKDLQSPYLMEDRVFGVQFVGRYERLSEDFQSVCHQLHINPPSLPHLKAGFRKHQNYRDFYDSASKRQVERAFGEDIERFNYAF